MKKFWIGLKIFAAIVVIIIIAIPFLFLFFYLRKQKKTITICPKISIKEIENKDEVDTKALGDAIKAAEDIMKKFKG